MKRLRTLLDNKELLKPFIPAEYEFTKLQLINEAKVGDELEVTYTKDIRYSASVKLGPFTKYTGLGTLTRQFRGYLSEGLYIDVDIVNCHPIILDTLTSHSVLREYCDKRDEFLTKHDITKEDFLSNLYNMYGKVHDNPLLMNLNSHLKNVLIPKLKQEFPTIWKRVLKKKVNQEGSFLANVVQHFECLILQECLQFAKGCVEIDVLIHDGFQVRVGENLDIAQFVTDLQIHISKHVFENRVFKDIKFKVKDFDQTLVNLLK